MKTDQSIIYMVSYQMFLHMMYWVGQVDYYCQKVMSLLVIMEIRWKVDWEVIGFEYSYVYFVIMGYSVQDYVQVEDVMQLSVDIL